MKTITDKDRLDWLDKNIFTAELDDFEQRIHGKETWKWQLFSVKGAQGTSRNIIDAAIKRENGE